MWDSLHTHTHHTINQIGASQENIPENPVEDWTTVEIRTSMYLYKGRGKQVEGVTKKRV